MNIAQSVALGLQFAFENSYTHINLELKNILLSDSWMAKLGNQCYGKFRKLINKNYSENEPEIILQFGKLLYKLLCCTGPLDEEVQIQNLKFPPEVPKDLQDLIVYCCHPQEESRPSFKDITTDKFDSIFYEADSISIDKLFSIWAKMPMSRRRTVLWKDFVTNFCDALQLPLEDYSIELKCLLEMLGGNEIVTEDSFVRLAKCIGPFIEGFEVLEHVRGLLESPWFMGFLSAQEADKILEPLNGRPFLLRFSSNPGEYSVTFKSKQIVLHSRVPKNAKYHLPQYVALLKKKKKFQETPPSPFRHIFNGRHQHLIQHNKSYVFLR